MAEVTIPPGETGTIVHEPVVLDRKRLNFEAGRHLSTIKGQDYLEVKWRLAWLRAEEPDAKLETRMELFDGDRAIFSARAELPGGAVGTGFGSCTAGEFGNFIEKAETKAIGRALASLGFGTQFTEDFSDGPEVLADAPVSRNQQPRQQQQRPPQQQNRGGGSGPQELMSPAQRGKILGTARQMGVTPQDLEQIAVQVTGAGLQAMTKKQASTLIDHLSGMTPGAAQNTPQGPRSAGPNTSGTAGPGLITAGQEQAIKRLQARMGLSDTGLLDYIRSTAAEDIANLQALSFDGAGEVIAAMQDETPKGR